MPDFYFIAIYLIGNKDLKGFVLMMSGNCSWFAVGYLAGSTAMILVNVVFMSMNTRALLKWLKPA